MTQPALERPTSSQGRPAIPGPGKRGETWRATVLTIPASSRPSAANRRAGIEIPRDPTMLPPGLNTGAAMQQNPSSTPPGLGRNR